MAITPYSGQKVIEVAGDGVIGTSGAETEVVSVYAQGGAAVLYNGTSTGGTKILTLADGDAVYYGSPGVICEDGLYVDWTTGTISISYRQG